MEMTPSEQGKPGRPDVAVIITRQALAAMRAESFLRAEETGGHLHGVLSEGPRVSFPPQTGSIP